MVHSITAIYAASAALARLEIDIDYRKGFPNNPSLNKLKSTPHNGCASVRDLNYRISFNLSEQHGEFHR